VGWASAQECPPSVASTIRTMHAELRALDSVDAPDGLAAFAPPDPERVAIAVGATIGLPDVEGGDLFYFNVVTAAWLADNPPPKGFEFARNLLVTRWDYETVRRAISDLCLRAEGRDWQEVATKLSRAAHWEFEDYRE
jgi:Immunity protein 8